MPYYVDLDAYCKLLRAVARLARKERPGGETKSPMHFPSLNQDKNAPFFLNGKANEDTHAAAGG